MSSIHNFTVKSLRLHDVKTFLEFLNKESRWFKSLSLKYNFKYNVQKFDLFDYGSLFLAGEPDDVPYTYVSITKLFASVKQDLPEDPVMRAIFRFRNSLQYTLRTIDNFNSEDIWVDSVMLDNMLSRVLSQLPERGALKQMDKTPIDPTQQLQNSIPAVNQQVHATSMNSQPMMTPLTVEHLPQLATMVQSAQLPVTYNAPISETISFGMPIETRTTYLPPDAMVYGGVVEDLKDLALGSYQVNETIVVPVNTQEGTVVFRKKYGLDMLGGYARKWVNLHKRYNGPITFRARIKSSAVISGIFRIGWNIGDNTIINIQNSSKYGAMDFDLKQPDNVFDFTIQPVAEPTGRFFFTTDTEPVDQGFIFGMLLTSIGNDFSNLGNIEIVIESRLHPNFVLADPIDLDDEPVSLNSELKRLLEVSPADLSKSTIFIETRKYPKYPDAPGNPTVKKLGYLGGMLAPYDGRNLPTATAATLVDANYINVYSDTVLQQSDNVRPKEFRRTTVIIPNPGGVFIKNDVGETLTEDSFSFKYEDIKLDGVVNTVESIAIERRDGRTDSGVYTYTPQYTVDLSAGSITAVSADSSVDTTTLPAGFYTVEIGPTDLPALSPEAAAIGYNLVPRTDAGWIIHNYCKANCPEGGQVKISLVDPIFNTTQVEFLYRPDVGFFTNATEEKRFSFLDSNIGAFILQVELQQDTSTTLLRNDLDSFISLTAPTRRYRKQMFSILGGMLGGIGQGIGQSVQNNFDRQQQQDRLDNNITITGMQGDQALANIRATGQNNLSNIREQGVQDRINMAREFSFKNLGNNLFHSPMNRAANTTYNQAYSRNITSNTSNPLPIAPVSRPAIQQPMRPASGTVPRSAANGNPSPTLNLAPNRAGVIPISGTGTMVSYA